MPIVHHKGHIINENTKLKKNEKNSDFDAITNELNDEYDKEYMAGFKYIISRNFETSAHYYSDMGFGLGITLNY